MVVEPAANSKVQSRESSCIKASVPQSEYYKSLESARQKGSISAADSQGNSLAFVDIQKALSSSLCQLEL